MKHGNKSSKFSTIIKRH